MTSLCEEIASGGRVFAIVVRAATTPVETTFLTPDTYNLQLGFVVYPAGGEVARHSHKPVERRTTGTSEVLFVRGGSCELDIYDDRQVLVALVSLDAGDTVLMVAGGHRIRMRQDTVLLEVKQGPYGGIDEKERF